MAIKEKIKVEDRLGFIYEVDVEHYPAQGFSLAIYRGRIIASVELGKINQPFGDNDREWEMYEESLFDWMCEIGVNLVPACREYFNDQLVTP